LARARGKTKRGSGKKKGPAEEEKASRLACTAQSFEKRKRRPSSGGSKAAFEETNGKGSVSVLFELVLRSREESRDTRQRVGNSVGDGGKGRGEG